MKILVTGGAGYIGSHTTLSLLEQGHDVVVVDNFVNASFESIRRVETIVGKKIKLYEVDVNDRVALSQVFAENDIDGVIHFAALKAVGESVEKPLAYYHNNVSGTVALLEVMEAHNVRNIVFSSSATVYGSPKSNPITEDFSLSTTNPYGSTKLMVEMILGDLVRANPLWNAVVLRYFNPIGAHPSGLIGEDPNGIPNNLVPYIAKVAVGTLASLSVFGDDYDTHDGTGVRDYIHVCDLAEGHVLALNQFKSQTGFSVFNLGTGKGYSVLDVVKAYQKAADTTIPYEVKPRRAGDIAACFANPQKAKSVLGWQATRDLETMCHDSYNWQKNNPNGYQK